MARVLVRSWVVFAKLVARKKRSFGISSLPQPILILPSSSSFLLLTSSLEMLAIIASASSLLFGLCLAHASMNPPVSTGSYSQSNMRIPHGCNGSDTTSVRVSIPANLSSVKPQKVAGWTMTIAKRPLAVPITSESGASITDEVDSVSMTLYLHLCYFWFGV